MTIRAGELDRRIRIEQRSTLRDEAGAPLDSWDLVTERWASIARTPGSEVFASAQREGRVPTVFRLRALSGVVPAMRIVCEGRTYNITSVLPQRRLDGEMLITAEELVEEPAT